MKKIGVYICNYNRAEMVVNCIRNAIAQSYREIDIYVVDNASTDDSVMRIKDTFGDRVQLFENTENIGNSGGVGMLVDHALASEYEYFMLLDNDAYLKETALEKMHRYMEENPDVGICGAKILNMQMPEYIQDFGGWLDYENYNWGGIMAGYKNISANANIDVDYVAGCAVLVRTEAARVFGHFPSKNFIYWDDIEWCTKCKNAGYRVAVCGGAEALHNKAHDTPRNLFLRYYANRNRYRYFAKYIPYDDIERFYEIITRDVFLRIKCALLKGMTATADTYMNAFLDFIDDVYGKAKEGKIPEYNEGVNGLDEYIKGHKIIFIKKEKNTDLGHLYGLIDYISRINQSAEITVYEGELKGTGIVLCNHITEVAKDILPNIYVDKFYNYIVNEEKMKEFLNFESNLDDFRKQYFDRFMKEVQLLRSEE